MKVLVSWLCDYVETGLSAEQIANTLSDMGFPNEGIEYLDGGDAVIDLEITSNRGDCLGYIGVARELAAATGKELKMPHIDLEESDKKVTDLCSVEIVEPELCGRYTARVIENVTVGPCPQWMKSRLEAIGMRSVNNVVDATNYAMMETGQPPHAFDYDKITDGKIIVRKAKAGERIISIDASKCDLNPEMLIIADSKVPVAVAGVMGGLDSEVSDDTKTVLLEDASFDPVSVRTTSRALTLPSEASFRFERIVDIENIEWASERTAQLIVQVAGGQTAKGVVDVYPKKPAQKQVAVRLSRIKHLLGIEVPKDKVVSIFESLSMEPKVDGDIVNCVSPTWRHDIHREADLIEEVARVYGYDKVPTRNKIEIDVIAADKRQKLSLDISEYLNGCGFYETINVTFVDDKMAQLFGTTDAEKHLSVKDVSRKNANRLRSSLLASLMGVLITNINAGNRPCRIFEIANTFVPAESELPVERTKLALVCDSDLREIVGVVKEIVEKITKAKVKVTATEISWAQAAGDIFVDDKQIGTLGLLNENTLRQLGLDDEKICAAELDFNTLLDWDAEMITFKAIPRYPAISRDLSLLIDEQVTWEQISTAIDSVKCDILENTDYVGTYRGKGVDAGKKSLTLTLRFRDEDGTLTHEQVDEFDKAIFDSIANSTGAILRGV